MHVQYLSILFEEKINIDILTRIYDFLLENITKIKNKIHCPNSASFRF